MERAAGREEKVEKVEEEVKHDVSFGSTPTICRNWYFFFFQKIQKCVFFYFVMQIKKCFEFDLLTLKCKLYDPFEKSVKENCSTILQRVICLFFGT
jgi:hypothetical protein